MHSNDSEQSFIIRRQARRPLNWQSASAQRAAAAQRKSARRLLVLLLLGGVIAFHASMLFRLWPELSQGHSDFVAFYGAGKAVRHGLGAQLYDQQVLANLQNAFAARLVKIHRGPLPYTHPPYEAAIFAPLAGLPYSAAFAIWDIVSLVTLLLSVLLLRPFLPRLCGWSGALPFLCALAFFPILVCLLNGQDCIVILLCFTGAFAAMKHRRDFLAGACFGLALLKFQYVAPMLAIFLLSRKWKLFAGWTVTAAALMLASVAVAGWHSTLEYPHALLVLSQSSTDLTVTTDMPNLRSIIEHLLGTSSLATNAILALVSLTLITFVARRSTFDPRKPSFGLDFSLAVAVSLIVSYHLWTHDLTLLLLPLLLVSEALLEGSLARSARSVLLPVVVLLFFSPLAVLLASLNWLVPALFWAMVVFAVGIAIAIPRGHLVTPRQPMRCP